MAIEKWHRASLFQSALMAMNRGQVSMERSGRSAGARADGSAAPAPAPFPTIGSGQPFADQHHCNIAALPIPHHGETMMADPAMMLEG